MNVVEPHIEYLNVLCLVSDIIPRDSYQASMSNSELKCFTTFHYPEELFTLKAVQYDRYDIVLLEASLIQTDWIEYLQNSVPIPIIFLIDSCIKKNWIDSLIYDIKNDFICIDDNNQYLSSLPNRIIKCQKSTQNSFELDLIKRSVAASARPMIYIENSEDGFDKPAVYSNQQFKESFFDNREREIDSSILSECLDFKNNNELRDLLLLAVAKNETTSIRAKIYVSNNVAKWYAIEIEPLRIGNKAEASHLALYFVDITEDIANERSLAEAKIEVEDARRSEQLFLATMSHEIRTPITSITGLTKLLSTTSMSAEQIDYLSSIESSTDLLITLVNDILDFSKIEKKAIDLSMDEFNLEKACTLLSKPFEQNAQTKKIKFNYFFDERIDQKVVADQTRIQQILLNLIGNAIKYTQYGEVSFKVMLLQDEQEYYNLRFSIVDTGKGISEDELPHIFKKYKQYKDSAQPDVKGTGLGLYIVDNIVKLLGGQIEVRSKIGVGSEFAFNLTLKKSDNDEEVVSNHHSGSIENVKILVIEDNELNREILMKQIENKAGIPIGVANGAEALPLLSGLHNFDAILMDLNMPVLNGVECIKIIRNVLDSNIPVIVLSANEQENAMFQEIKPFVNDTLSKPYNLEELVNKISAAISIPVESDFSEPCFTVEPIRAVSDSDEFVNRMIQTTYREINEASENLTRGLKHQDLFSIQQACHKTKSTAGYISASAVEKLCGLTEMTAKQENTDLTLALTQCLKIRCERLLFKLEQDYPTLNLETTITI